MNSPENKDSRWQDTWAVIKGASLNPDKALSRNAGIGVFFITGAVMMTVLGAEDLLSRNPAAYVSLALYASCGLLTCYSWLVARKDKARRNALLILQGKLFLALMISAAIWFSLTLWGTLYPSELEGARRGRISYSPGIILASLIYFGRHLSDFNPGYKGDLKKYTKKLIIVGVVFEVVIIFLFIQVITGTFGGRP